MDRIVAGTLGRITAHLDKAGIPYMVVGSVAAGFHGEPRSTLDIDIVINPDRSSLDVLVKDLIDADYYVDPDTAREAFDRHSMFNVIDNQEVWKVDLIVHKPSPRSALSLHRRVEQRIGTEIVHVESAEDVVLSKLEWAKRGGGSERQLRDVAGILLVSGAKLDWNYIEDWVPKLGLEALWHQLTQDMSRPSPQ